MIRRLLSTDLDACVDVYVATFAAPPWNETWSSEDARLRLGDFLATPRSCGVVRLDGDAVVGFALGHLERNGADDHFLLQEMVVATSRQGAGIGGELLDGLAAELPGVEHWYLLTMRSSPAARFYEARGFRAAQRMGVWVRP